MSPTGTRLDQVKKLQQDFMAIERKFCTCDMKRSPECFIDRVRIVMSRAQRFHLLTTTKSSLSTASSPGTKSAHRTQTKWRSAPMPFSAGGRGRAPAVLMAAAPPARAAPNQSGHGPTVQVELPPRWMWLQRHPLGPSTVYKPWCVGSSKCHQWHHQEDKHTGSEPSKSGKGRNGGSKSGKGSSKGGGDDKHKELQKKMSKQADLLTAPPPTWLCSFSLPVSTSRTSGSFNGMPLGCAFANLKAMICLKATLTTPPAS